MATSGWEFDWDSESVEKPHRFDALAFLVPQGTHVVILQETLGKSHLPLHEEEEGHRNVTATRLSA